MVAEYFAGGRYEKTYAEADLKKHLECLATALFTAQKWTRF